MQLALAALPSDGDDRPLTSEAIRALTDATLAYSPLSGTSIHAVWTYNAPSRIMDMKLSPARTSLTSRDALNTVTVWDTETHEILLEKSFGRDSIYSISYLGDKELLIVTAHDYTLYDVFKGKTIWSKTLDEGVFKMMDPLMAEDAESFYLFTLYHDVLHISTDDGSILDMHHFPDSSDFSESVSYDGFQLSPDETRIAVSISSSSQSAIGVLKLSDDSFSVLQVSMPDVRSICWIDDDTLVACCYDYFLGQNSLYADARVINPQTDTICCFSLSSEKELWSQDFVYSSSVKKRGFLNLPEIGAVAYFCGDMLKIYDVATGEVTNYYDLNSPLVEINDNDHDGYPLFITSDGYLGSPVDSVGPNTASLTNEFTDKIYQAITGGGVYILQEYSNKILFYDVYVADEEWTEMDDDIVLNIIRADRYLDENYLVVSSLISQSTDIVAYDANEKDLLWRISLGQDIGSECEILGVFDDELYVICRHDYQSIVLMRIDMEDGEIIDEEELSNISGLINNIFGLDENYLMYIYKDEKAQGQRLRLRDLETGEEEKFVLPFDNFVPQLKPRYYQEANAIYYSDVAEGDYIIDVEEHDEYKVKLPKDWVGTTFVEVNPTGDKWVIADNAHVLELDSEGKVILEIETNGLVPLGAAFYQMGKKEAEHLVVVYNDGSMIRYLADDGTFEGKSSVETYVDSTEYAKLHFSSDMGTLYIQMGDIMDVVETENWVELAVIWNSLGYHELSDSFFAFSFTNSKDFHIGYFRHYTLQDLIDKANKILGGVQMSDEQKSQYGIS